MSSLPSVNPIQEIPCIVQSEKQWLRELKARFTSLEQVAFRCPCGHVQSVQDVME